MGDIQTRPFSKNYSGLINQSVIAIGITVLCATGQELMKRRRRGAHIAEGLGSRESWEFGYLYQGRSWAKDPSPPTPRGWPLSWVKQAIKFPEAKMLELRGVDATLYIRFLRGCFWFTLLHTFTTFPILFPIHVEFSEDAVSPTSMTRASISSLVTTAKGRSLLWIHICLLFWVTFSWITTLIWICNGTFKLRRASLELLAKRVVSPDADPQYYPHPHPQYSFADVPIPDRDFPNRGLRLRTIMVSNLPHALRNEKDLKEYFQYYMSRKLEKPSMGLTSSTQPGFFNKSFAFVFNRAKKLPAHLPPIPLITSTDGKTPPKSNQVDSGASRGHDDVPMIDRVVIVRKMTDIASLLERREEILCLLETAHIKLARKTLVAVKEAMDRRSSNMPISSGNNRAAEISRKRRSAAPDTECGDHQQDPMDKDARMDQLIKALGPFVEEFGLQESLKLRSRKVLAASSRYAFRKVHVKGSEGADMPRTPTTSYPPRPLQVNKSITIWEALHSLPRSSLDAYQPLVNLSHLFRGKTVPAIDYYTAKLNLISSLVTESRSKAMSEYEPVSTAFVTFADPADARRACKYLAVHPNNPLACMVSMAPMYQDLDWIRLMKTSFKVEFLKDWVVNIGVWGFTLFWLFPVSLLVGLVSIQNISVFWPSLKSYLDSHPWEEELIQSFLPTLLVALLALLIPLILLLIAKKAHTITTLSVMHDRIMTRYYKFLIVNVLVFFCVGTATMQSLLQSFKLSGDATHPDVLQIVADSFPTAGPFYVGWLIFTTAIHGGFEVSLLGLPLIMYPSTARQLTPRKRAVGTRPRTFNFYYWLPNHLLVIHVLLLFSVLNPFVLPFGTLYFFVQTGIVKNQLLHVYAKNYEANGQVILIRILRYSLDGLILTQAVFLAYMVVLKKTVNVGLSACLIILTTLTKLLMTRMCRAQFEQDDIEEANIMCGNFHSEADVESSGNQKDSEMSGTGLINPKHHRQSSILTWKLPEWLNFSYASLQHQPHQQRRQPNPFHPQRQEFARLQSISDDEIRQDLHQRGLHVPEVPSQTPVTEFPWGGIPLGNDNVGKKLDPSGPVVSHPPPIPWDDQTTVDLPYDNPFYTRTFHNVLWLPRNPCGILDLDETVDLKVSLCVDAAAGQLGTWLGLVEVTSPEEAAEVQSSPSADQLGLSTTSNPFDGTEEIDLPPVIAQRVQSREGDVEQTIRPRRPTFRRKLSSLTVSSTATQDPRRPSVLGDSTPSQNFRSFSDGKRPTTAGRARSGSILSVLQYPHLQRAKSAEPHEFGERPTFHLQPEVIERPKNASNPHLSVASRTRSHNISAREAIFNEVMAEEKAALIDRIEDEEAQTQKATSTKSWMTAWMFRRPE